MIIEEHRKTFDPDKPRDFIDIYLTELEKSKDIDPSFSGNQMTTNKQMVRSKLLFDTIQDLVPKRL